MDKKGTIKKCAVAMGVLSAAVAAGCTPSSGTTSELSGFDYAGLPYYDTQAIEKTYDSEEYKNTFISRPYWQGNVIYNEIVTLVEGENGVIEGQLQYPALKVLSVRDYTLETEYVAGTDYSISGNKITALEGSSMPHFRDEWFLGVNVPEPYERVESFAHISNSETQYTFLTPTVLFTESGLVYKNYIHVTYVYDPAEVDRTLMGGLDSSFDYLRTKLEVGDDITLAAVGDSIGEGFSASEFMNRAPYCPNFVDLTADAIEKNYGVHVNIKNLSKGGMTSAWGATDSAPTIGLTQSAPDMLIIHFAGNDAGSGMTGSEYRRNIKSIMDRALAANNHCTIVLMVPFPFHPEYIPTLRLDEYREILKELTSEYGCVYLDMRSVGEELMKTRPYYGVAVNNASHPNDYMGRLYAMKILAALIAPQNK